MTATPGDAEWNNALNVWCGQTSRPSGPSYVARTEAFYRCPTTGSRSGVPPARPSSSQTFSFPMWMAGCSVFNLIINGPSATPRSRRPPRFAGNYSEPGTGDELRLWDPSVRQTKETGKSNLTLNTSRGTARAGDHGLPVSGGRSSSPPPSQRDRIWITALSPVTPLRCSPCRPLLAHHPLPPLPRYDRRHRARTQVLANRLINRLRGVDHRPMRRSGQPRRRS